MRLLDQAHIFQRLDSHHLAAAVFRSLIQHINMVATHHAPALFLKSLRQPVRPLASNQGGLSRY
jgi:hypothetical protein